MCFSAEASFTASAVIAVISGMNLKSIKSKNFFLLGFIPFLFALQQFSEGILWISLPYPPLGPMGILAKYYFITFAYLMWPILIPLAFILIEPDPGRKKLLYGVLFLGLSQSLILSSNIIHHGVEAAIFNKSIQYDAHIQYSYILPTLYVIGVVFPWFISSLKATLYLGILAALSFMIASLFFYATLASVWCFLAAFISLLFYVIIKLNDRVEESIPSNDQTNLV